MNADERGFSGSDLEFEDGHFDPWELAAMDCGLLPDGTCSEAGSEECDFECPFAY